MLSLVLVIEMSVFGLSLKQILEYLLLYSRNIVTKTLRRIDVVDSLGRKNLGYLLDI